eukprot:SAG11_NODE_496_length_8931_cov_2.956015_4_plen_167_part_00
MEAEEAEATAALAWRMSEQSLSDLHSECAPIRRCALNVEEQLAALRRPRRAGGSSRGASRASWKDERARRAAVVLLAETATALAGVSSRAWGMLDRYYWGVWGSARRCRASAREVRALAEAVREDLSLPQIITQIKNSERRFRIVPQGYSYNTVKYRLTLEPNVYK